ncbi:MAG: hypothetical protein ABS36_00050 [Acidobacteria bacterium SCN 69-37]|nr:MAG: hypothetical protein ABS36_00050 [Acidobacteria bacterium SCN 69-37]
MHVGLWCIQGSGHLYPMGALGRELMARGHEVTCFQDLRARGMLKAAGVRWAPIGTAAPWRPHAGEFATPGLMLHQAKCVLDEGTTAAKAAGVDAFVVDQCDLAAGSVADRLGLPFVNVSFFPPVFLDDSTPPHTVGWGSGDGRHARRRNRGANRALVRAVGGVIQLVNRQRAAWNLPPHNSLNDFFSSRAIVAQLPECLELPRPRPPHLYYTGPFLDGRGRHHVWFPWEALDGRPIVYATLGTVRNRAVEVFHTIAAACSVLPVQLILSLGGFFEPNELPTLPGSPIVVQYAPQLELLSAASICITHAGLNTTLEALTHGVPLVAVPITDDQPGVAARIRRARVGRVVPLRRLTVDRLTAAVDALLSDRRYREAAGRVRAHIAAANGLTRAADIIEVVVRS